MNSFRKLWPFLIIIITSVGEMLVVFVLYNGCGANLELELLD